MAKEAFQDARMMRRLVTVLWLIAATIIVVFAENAAHFSPWEFIVPGRELWTWLAPLALFGTPLLLLVSRVAAKSLAPGLTWAALVLLALPFLGVLTFITFPKQTGYYDPDDPDRQPGGVPSEHHRH
jgi:hypothetical protein